MSDISKTRFWLNMFMATHLLGVGIVQGCFFFHVPPYRTFTPSHFSLSFEISGSVDVGTGKPALVYFLLYTNILITRMFSKLLKLFFSIPHMYCVFRSSQGIDHTAPRSGVALRLMPRSGYPHLGIAESGKRKRRHIWITESQWRLLYS